MLSDKRGKKLNTYTADYCIYDLETTGTNPEIDDVVEISAVKVLGGVVTEEFTTLVNPGRPIPSMASDVNGITDEMVKDAPDFETALKNFLDFAGDMVLIGHNIHRFDMHFLWRDAEKYWGKTVGNDYMDTLQLAWMYLPDRGHYTLSSLCTDYGITTEGAHRALYDCRMNQKLYECLGKEMQHPSAAALAVPKCPRCGSMLKKRDGKFGEFWGCTNYPDCRYTKNV